MRFGLTSEERSDTILLQDTPLNEDVEYAVKKAREVFKADEFATIPEHPIFLMDTEGGHGASNVGMIFKQKAKRIIPSMFIEQHELVFRVSFGTNKPYEDKDIFVYWDPKTIPRLHLSVYGQRQFYTEEQLKTLSKLKPGDSVIGTKQDEINFSIRWLDRKFDDWNSNQELFNQARTTYASHHKYWYGGFTTHEEVHNHLLKLKPIESKLEGVIALEEREIDDWGRKKHLKIATGYEPILSLLAKYGDINPKDAAKIPQMTYRESIDYLLDKILPCVRAFVRD